MSLLTAGVDMAMIKDIKMILKEFVGQRLNDEIRMKEISISGRFSLL